MRSPFGNDLFEEFFNGNPFDADFFNQMPNFHFDIGPDLWPEMPPLDSLQQQPKKRKTTRL
jgi:hypothetical protein